MRIATIVLSILDAALWIVCAYLLFLSEDAVALGLDVGGWIATGLFVVTAVPAFLLALKSLWPKTALLLALAFPAGIIAGIVYVLFIW